MRRGKCDPKLLEKLLAESGHRPAELSTATEIPLSCIRGYFSGKRDAVSTRNMFLIAKFLDIPMSQLVDYLAKPEQSAIKGLE